ncbi:MAG TPA: hypothetical protein VGX70_01665 [Gemmataceae bacterium]|jgi:hypothetical protein|nr:hypothetical protein [Gemmataceae bacterium]
MSVRRQLVFIWVGILGSLGASYRTVNFQVEAPTPQIAQQVGLYAEKYRQQKALDWLGREMPPWPEPCPIHVTVNMGGAGGATSFAFDRGRVLGQHMNIEGSLDRLLASVLPHEVTHTVFAYYYRMPVPRWADEGGAVLSEDDVERNRHDMICRQILNAGRQIPLRRLFTLRDYPGDVMCLYAEGFSVVNYLVNNSSRPIFLAFVAHGMNYGWDSAVQTYYRYQSVEELEQAWLGHLRQTKRNPTLLAQNTNPSPADSPGRMTVRQTNPPTQPSLVSSGPVFRGQSPQGEENGRFGEAYGRPAAYGQPTGQRPGYLPESIPTVSAPPYPTPQAYPSDQWQPAGASPGWSSPVILGPPQAATPIPQPVYVQQQPGYAPSGYTPPGFPR